MRRRRVVLALVAVRPAGRAPDRQQDRHPAESGVADELVDVLEVVGRVERIGRVRRAASARRATSRRSCG